MVALPCVHEVPADTKATSIMALLKACFFSSGFTLNKSAAFDDGSIIIDPSLWMDSFVIRAKKGSVILKLGHTAENITWRSGCSLLMGKLICKLRSVDYTGMLIFSQIKAHR